MKGDTVGHGIPKCTAESHFGTKRAVQGQRVRLSILGVRGKDLLSVPGTRKLIRPQRCAHMCTQEIMKIQQNLDAMMTERYNSLA
jgi:hypothetical protein